MITKRIVIESSGTMRVTAYLCLNHDRKPFITDNFRKASMSEKVVKLILKMKERSKTETAKVIEEYVEKNFLKPKDKNDSYDDRKNRSDYDRIGKDKCYQDGTCQVKNRLSSS